VGGRTLEPILIRGARYLLTVRGGRRPRSGPLLKDINAIQDGAVLIRDGVLLEVGPTRRVENLAQARDAIEVNAAGRVVMPGFIDAHTHLAFPPAGIHTADPAAAAKAVHTATGQRLEARAREFLEAMIRHGTTTMETKTGCGLDQGAESKLLRMLCSFRKGPVDVVPSFLFRLPAEINGGSVRATEWVIQEVLPKIRRRGVARFADLLWDGDSGRIDCYRRYLEAARQLGFGCKIHAAGTAPAGAVALAAEHRVASIDHLEHATAEEVRLLAEAGVLVTLLPGAWTAGGNGIETARALIDGGVPVALGSNFNPHHTPALSMQAVLAQACQFLGMTIEEAIVAATINSAHALGCADTAGSLEPGKSADLIMLNAGHYRDLETCLGTNLVHLTMKAGRFVYREGDVAPLEPNALLPKPRKRS
jgi:imidazolonepropionase